MWLQGALGYGVSFLNIRLYADQKSVLQVCTRKRSTASQQLPDIDAPSFLNKALLIHWDHVWWMQFSVCPGRCTSDVQRLPFCRSKKQQSLGCHIPNGPNALASWLSSRTRSLKAHLCSSSWRYLFNPYPISFTNAGHLPRLNTSLCQS